MTFGADAQTYQGFQAVTVFEKPMLFTTAHLDHTTIPDGVYLYAVRHGENRKQPIEVCQWALVNRYGSLLSATPLDLQPYPRSYKKDNRYKAITSNSDWIPGNRTTTLSEYLLSHPIQKSHKT